MQYGRIKPVVFNRFIGLSIEKFGGLARKIAPLGESIEIKKLSQEGGKRAIGGGKQYKLKTLEDNLLLLFIFYKIYPTYELLRYLFVLDQANIYRLIRRLEWLVSLVFRLPKLPPRQIFPLEQIKDNYPEILEFVIDVIEQQLPCPKNKLRQKLYYSSRKKRYTYLDKGYQGIKEDYPHVRSIKPLKANRWQILSMQEKKYKKEINRIRVNLEHSINRCKRFNLHI
ncbi:MAG: hypothetical protein NC820_06270 [Candidatus Omnitrophica bacterium]|nr:hypothetical protein [Candidatus Omnitrophota bacterium]